MHKSTAFSLPVRLLRALLLAAALTALSAPAALAQQEPAAATAAQNTAPGTSLTPRTPGEASSLSNQISNEIYSPFCPGKTLEMCPSSNASEVRQQIQALALEGQEKQDIVDTIIAQIGEKYRITEPPAEDNYMLLGALLLAFIICLGIIFFVGRKARKSAGADDSDRASSDDELSIEDRLYLEELRGEYLD